MLFPNQGVKPVSLALKVQHLNCWLLGNSLHCLQKFLFYWRRLQCCISFICTVKWLSYNTSVYLLLGSFPHIGQIWLAEFPSSIVGPQYLSYIVCVYVNCNLLIFPFHWPFPFGNPKIVSSLWIWFYLYLVCKFVWAVQFSWMANQEEELAFVKLLLSNILT